MNDPDSIAPYIMRAVDEAIAQCGREPKAIYLGIEEYRALKEHARTYMLMSAPTQAMQWMEFRGMRVYQVLETSHIGVA